MQPNLTLDFTSGAPPAQVLGYQRVFINGVPAKIPYYGV